MITAHKPALPYDPADEEFEKDEAETTRELIETMRDIQQKVLDDSGHAERSVHAKSYGILEGEVKVFDDLLPMYAQGVFQPGATYPAVLRISAIPGDILPDEITAPRGLSLKLFGVEGARLEGSEGDATQDFVMVNGHHFQTPTAKAFLANLKLLEKTTDRIEGVKKAASVVNRALEQVLEAFGGESANLKGLGGAPMTHPLGDSFYSQSAFRYGDHVAKFAVAPVDPALVALHDKPVDIKGRDNGYRELVMEHIAAHGGEWDIRVQLRTDRDMPIEDASKEWSQDDSPYVPVARITVKPQPGWSEARSKTVDDGYAFSVWHGVEAHRPLGRINRVRKDNYKAAAEFRGRANGCPMHEPRSWQGLPG